MNGATFVTLGAWHRGVNGATFVMGVGRPGRAILDRRMTNESSETVPVAPTATSWLARLLGWRNLTVASLVHSVLFTGLILCAFVLGKPQPATFVFGFTHGVLYMLMGAACIVAARLRIVPITTVLVVVIVGLFGPYFGAYEFVREHRKRTRASSVPDLG